MGIGPLVVLLCHLHDAFHGCKIRLRHTGLFGKRLPVGLVDHHDLRGLGDRKKIQCSIVVKISLLHIRIHVFRQLILGKILRKIGQLSLLLHGIGRICIGGENIRKVLRAHLLIQRAVDGLLQIRHRSIAVALNIDAFLLADRRIEFLQQLIEGCLLGSVVIMPYGKRDRIVGIQLHLFAAVLRLRSAACHTCCHRHHQHDRRQSSLLHPILSLILSAKSATVWFFRHALPECSYAAGRLLILIPAAL